MGSSALELEQEVLDMTKAVTAGTCITKAALPHFIQCPFPNQSQFGLEKLNPKNE